MHNASAVDTGARADVDYPVGRANGVFVVFDDDERVSEVLEGDQGFDQTAVVALVKADARFVEHIENTGEAGSDLRSQTDALGLTAGE